MKVPFRAYGHIDEWTQILTSEYYDFSVLPHSLICEGAKSLDKIGTIYEEESEYSKVFKLPEHFSDRGISNFLLLVPKRVSNKNISSRLANLVLSEIYSLDFVSKN